jgi:hypothetical protein
MKTKLRLAGALLGVLSLFVVTLPISGHVPKLQDQETKAKDAKVKTGSEVAQRVKQLKQANKDVRNALGMFENNEKKNGHKPKIEESRSFTSRVSLPPQARMGNCKTCPPLKKVGFHPQDPASDDVIEIIFVPTYVTSTEWQGTVIATLYDGLGNFLDQYIADVVIWPDAVTTEPTVVYEVSFEAGQAWLQSDATLGMITDPNFQWGTPVDQQDPSILPSLISANFPVKVLRKVSYTMEPQQCCTLLLPVNIARNPSPRTRKFFDCVGTYGGLVPLGTLILTTVAAPPLGSAVALTGSVVGGCAGRHIFNLF